jgi:hypothetical protein
MQRLAQLLQENAASAAACVRTLLQLQQQGQLPPSLCPLLYWLHVSSGHLSPADEAAVTAAVQCSANRQQPLTAASSCGSDAAAHSSDSSSGGGGMVTLQVVVWSLEQLLQCETGRLAPFFSVHRTSLFAAVKRQLQPSSGSSCPTLQCCRAQVAGSY